MATDGTQHWLIRNANGHEVELKAKKKAPNELYIQAFRGSTGTPFAGLHLIVNEYNQLEARPRGVGDFADVTHNLVIPIGNVALATHDDLLTDIVPKIQELHTRQLRAINEILNCMALE